MNPNNQITPKQNSKINMILEDISRETGYTFQEIKQILEEKFKKGYSTYSSSRAEASEFITFLIDFVFYVDAPLRVRAANLVDDIEQYLFVCLKNKKCAVCGSAAEIHHWDAIGMGMDRRYVDDSKLRKVALCRKHHTEAHTIGREAFKQKYRIYGIIYDTRKEKT